MSTLLAGASLSLAIEGAALVINGVATVTETDIVSSNGIIHVIDAVLTPEVAEPPAEWNAMGVKIRARVPKIAVAQHPGSL